MRSQFALVNISRTVNPTWYSMAPQSTDELAAKTLLYTGNMRGARQCQNDHAVDCSIEGRRGRALQMRTYDLKMLYADLNLYTSAGGGNGLLGWTYYPFQGAGVLDSSTIYWCGACLQCLANSNP